MLQEYHPVFDSLMQQGFAGNIFVPKGHHAEIPPRHEAAPLQLLRDERQQVVIGQIDTIRRSFAVEHFGQGSPHLLGIKMHG